MSNTTLKLIVKLFALFASLDAPNRRYGAGKILKLYLKLYVQDSYIHEFIDIYNFYIQQQTEAADPYKQISSKSVKTLRLLDQINSELIYQEKVYLLFYLGKLLREKDRITEQEDDFLRTVARSFSMPESESQDLIAFILYGVSRTLRQTHLLAVKDPYSNCSVKGIQYIDREGLNGIIYFLLLPSAHLYLFYYQGGESLFLNARKIDPGAVYFFSKGDSISGYRMGWENVKLQPIYYPQVAECFLRNSQHNQLSLVVDGASYLYRGEQEGIRPFNFSTQSFYMVGVIGSSGVGKSTLLNLLNGNIRPQHGHIWINGYDLHRHREDFKGLIGYVPQEDLLFEELTVYQNLYYNARLCFGDLSPARVHAMVNRTLDELALSSIRHKKVGGELDRQISGGQRKRLNLGLELMREPALLLVDEPTSGLSSSDSRQVMNLLRTQTLKGRLVIVNIHQPASPVFRLLDQLLVLDEGGRVTYTGDPLEGLVYFKTLNEQVNAQVKQCPTCGHINPEAILEIMEEKKVDQRGRYGAHRRISPEQWHQYYRDKIEPIFSQKPLVQPIPESRLHQPHRMCQFKLFFKRNILSKLGNKQYLLVSLLEAPLLALIVAYFTKYTAGTPENDVAYIFSQNPNLPAFLLMSVMVALFIGLLISSEEIIRDARVLQREKFLQLSRSGYLLSKIAFLLLLSAIQTFTYVLIANHIMGIEGMMFRYWSILFSTAVFANILGLNLSSGLGSQIVIYIVIPFILIPFMLFSGGVVHFDKLHAGLTPRRYPPIIADLMVSRWAYEALAVSQFRDNAYEDPLFSLHRRESRHAYRLNHYLPRLINHLDYCRNHLDRPEGSSMPERIATLRNEIHKLTREYEPMGKLPVEELDQDSLKIASIRRIRKFIERIRKQEARQMEQVVYQRDSLIQQSATAEQWTRLKQNHYNHALAELVKRKNNRVKVLETNHQLYRKYEPIFMYPHHPFGRSIFYAPTKRMGPYGVDTWWFNLSVIWLFNLALYISLYYDWLKGAVAFFSKLQKMKLKS